VDDVILRTRREGVHRAPKARLLLGEQRPAEATKNDRNSAADGARRLEQWKGAERRKKWIC
jgi:hypothetical protein